MAGIFSGIRQAIWRGSFDPVRELTAATRFTDVERPRPAGEILAHAMSKESSRARHQPICGALMGA
jgi:hypothetical protein